uniref:Cadherin domain-containing protein n=1 Tax=Periophthalmus magnuspinnatus TaxID=409849 RepID=A0A3B4AZD5_9GOBI
FIFLTLQAIDYEDIKHLDLGILIKNKAPIELSELETNIYEVKIIVENEPEGPQFDPKVKAIPISEGGTTINIKNTIGYYPAIDQDTGKQAENVRYVKGTDPGNWLIIDPVTADIKLNKLPDRESPLLVNGTYYAEVLYMPAKTVTGTLAIQVEDFNDHCPTLTSPVQTLCLSDDAVLVTAHDEDAFPNGPPFHFTIIPEHTQDTARILRSEESLWPGVYEVEFIVTDQQGESCPEPQRVLVQVCTCGDGVKCGKQGGNGQPEKEVEFGPAGICMLFLGLLLLLLIPLLALFCFCGRTWGMPGAFTEMPFDTKSHLINYHTEGQGENTVRDVPLINMQTTQIDGNMLNMSMGGTQISNMDLQQRTEMSREVINGYYQGYGASQMEGTWRGLSQFGGSAFQSEYMSRERETGIFDGMALPYHYLGQYYNQVSVPNTSLCVPQKMQSSETQTGKDNLLVYDYEGQGSSAGSLGSCSSLALDKDLHFLDDLDFKFKTLAKVCGGKTQGKVRAPAPPTTFISTSIRSHTGVSSVVAPGPLPVPTSLPIPKAEVISSSSEVGESSEHAQTITITEASREASGGPAPQASQAPQAAQAPQGQMLLLQQQPHLYYTTAPVLQSMHYMIQPPVQNTGLLREASGPNMQSVILVNSPQNVPAQGLVMQGQTVMQGPSVGQTGPGMVLVEKAQGPGASLSSSPTMMLVEGKGPSGSNQVLKNLVQPGLSGSQAVLVVGSGSAQGQQPGAKSSLSRGFFGPQRTLNKSSSSSTQNITGNSTPSSSQRVVVQETREVIKTNL